MEGTGDGWNVVGRLLVSRGAKTGEDGRQRGREGIDRVAVPEQKQTSERREPRSASAQPGLVEGAATGGGVGRTVHTWGAGGKREEGRWTVDGAAHVGMDVAHLPDRRDSPAGKLSTLHTGLDGPPYPPVSRMPSTFLLPPPGRVRRRGGPYAPIATPTTTTTTTRRGARRLRSM